MKKFCSLKKPFITSVFLSFYRNKNSFIFVDTHLNSPYALLTHRPKQSYCPFLVNHYSYWGKYLVWPRSNSFWVLSLSSHMLFDGPQIIVLTNNLSFIRKLLPRTEKIHSSTTTHCFHQLLLQENIYTRHNSMMTN